MTEPERKVLRRVIDREVRAALGEADPNLCPETGRALSYAYRALGCRCVTCRGWQAATRARRRQGDLRGPANERKEHGVSAYKRRGCRCPYCKAAVAAQRQRRRAAKKASAAPAA